MENQRLYFEAVLRVIKYSRKQLRESITRVGAPVKKNLTNDEMRRQYIDYLRESTRAVRAIRKSEIVLPQISDREFTNIINGLFSDAIEESQTDDQKVTVITLSNKEISERLFETLGAYNYPYYVRAVAYFSNGNQDDNIQRKEKFVHRIADEADKKYYIRNVIGVQILNYKFTQQHPDHFITHVDVEITNSQDKTKLTRVARYEAENCVINIIRGHIGDRADVIYDKFPELKPTSSEDKNPIFISHDQIESIARATKKCIITYTQLGSLENLPWHMYGDKHQKKIHMQISNEHATILPGKLKVSEIRYHQYIDSIPSDTNIVDCDYFYPDSPNDQPRPKYYTQLIDGKLIMNKIFRPSSVTKSIDDDSDIAHAYVFTAELMMYRIFKSTYGLAPIIDNNIRAVAKSAERFIGKRVLKPLTGLQCTEYDHNKNYIAYEKSQFYQGFPTNKLIPVKYEHSENPAFIICNNIENAPEAFQLFFEYKSGKIVLTNPTYRYLLSTGAIIDVDYVLDGEFQHISVFDFAESCDVSDENKKLFRNQLIGRTITGGVNESKIVNCAYRNNIERDQIIHECQSLNYEYADNDNRITVKISNKSRGLFNFHSYILSYASIYMMQKYHQLTAEGKSIIAFNVDALVCEGKFHESSEEVGMWKTGELKKYYYQFAVNEFDPENLTASDLQLPEIRICNRSLPRTSTVINGPAGISKSYPWLNDPAYNQIILVPTHELKNEFKKYYQNVHTAHKYFQFTIDDEKFRLLRATGKIPPEHMYVIVDERTMFNEQQWNIIESRKGNSIIIALGDNEQICNEIAGAAVTDRFFQRANYSFSEITRSVDGIARHSYEYGCKLDQLRGKNLADQREYISNNFETAEFSIDNCDLSIDRIAVGDHMTAHEYNMQAKKFAERTGSLFPFRTTGKQPRVVLLPIDTKCVFWNRMRLTDARPAGTKYEPAFAVTADSLQGKTISGVEILYVHINSLLRHGSVYTAMTRTRDEINTIVISDC